MRNARPGLAAGRAFLLGFLVLGSIPGLAESVFPLGKPVEREIGGPETHVYTLELLAGQYVKVVFEQWGIDLVVTASGPDQKKIIEVDSPSGAEGPERVELIAKQSGPHTFEVRAFAKDAPRARYEARLEEFLTSDQYERRLAAEASLAKAAQSEISRTAIPLRAADAGNGFADLQPLRDLGAVRVVALGEATHGTREFFQIKHRLFEFLVTEMGFNVFALEAPMAEAFDINDYVLTGQGDPRKALAALYYWAWNTEEVLQLIEWMRRYNADPARRRKLKFYGFDMQHPQRPAAVTAGYLKRVDPEFVLPPVVAMLADPFTSADLNTFSPKEKSDALAEVRRVRSRFDERKPVYVRRGGGERRWAMARQHAELLDQFLEDSSTGGTGAVRGRSMADNIRWILGREGAGTRIVVSAHNNHVATEPESSMGGFLRKALGSDLRAFGFAFNQGSFQAIEPGKGLRDFSVPPAPAGSLEEALSAAAPPLAILRLHNLSPESPLRRWLAEPRMTRDVGAVYRDADAADYLVRKEIARRYDGLVFVDRTTAARRNPGVQVIASIPLLAKPDNLDFEESEADGTPRHWLTLPGNASDFDFVMTTAADSAPSGSRAAVIRRDPGTHYGEMAGRLVQFVDATMYRGKRIRFRASARLQGDAASMFVWIRANRRGAGSIDERTRISGDRWQDVEMIIETPADATRIEYGMALTGDGQAWLDAIAIDVPGSSDP